jgi:hypothetical protein
MSRLMTLVLALALVVAACGDDDGGSEETETTPTTAAATTTTAGGETTTTTAPEATTTTTRAATTTTTAGTASSGGGAATITIGEETWTFDTVLCAFGEEQIGQEGAEFVLTATEGDLNLYLSIDSFGHSVSLANIADFSLAWEADTLSAQQGGGDAEFIEVSGSDVRADTYFFDMVVEDLNPVPGTVEAACG